jgi:hypothetical protein
MALGVNRRLTKDFEQILSFGPVKGADLWHLACALCLAAESRELTFPTLDKQQKYIANKLGFAT